MDKWFVAIICVLISCGGCMHKTELPRLVLQTSGDLDFEKKRPCLLLEMNGHDTVAVQAKAKWRGGWSRQFDKKSYTIDTGSPISLAGLPENTKWILNASYIDKTLIRHRFWYELWQSMSDNHIAAGCRYVRIFVDGIDQGIYIAMERIEESRLEISEGGVLFKDPQVFRKDSIPPEKKESYYHQKYPDPKIVNRDSVLHEFRSFILYADSTSFVDYIDQWIDLENVIDWHLLLLLSHNGDGVLKNFYLYKASELDKLKIIPWDYDHSAGRDGDNELNLRNTLIDDDRNILLDRLMKLNAQRYVDRRCQRWIDLRKTGVYSMNNINLQINKLKNILRDHVASNFEIWPYDGPGFFDTNDHEQEVDLMRLYLKNRINFLDDHFNCE